MIKDVQVDKWLNKKRAKTKFWEIKVFLKGLHLKFEEHNKGKLTYYIAVPLFGIKFKINGIEEPDDRGWKVFLIDVDKLKSDPAYYREDLMWYLVEKGYMQYIRNISENVFKNILMGAGWAVKIMKKRIELSGKDPEHTFMRITAEEMLKLPLAKIISFNPGYFDYLM